MERAGQKVINLQGFEEIRDAHRPSIINLQVIVQRFGLIARPLVIRSAKFLRECFRKVAHSRNTLRFAKSAINFLNERSFFTFFVDGRRASTIL